MDRATDRRLREALDALVFRAILWFVAAAAITTVPLLLRLPPEIHAASHGVLPAVWLGYAAFAWLRQRGATDSTDDPWMTAATRDPAGTRVAWLAAVGLPVGWLAAAIGLLAHHLSTSAGALQVVGIDLPILGSAWLLATLAWLAGSRRAVARGIGPASA